MSSQKISEPQYDQDVFIVGGGLVGASLALGLVGSDLSIAICDAVAASVKTQSDYDLRSLAISEASSHTLATLGVWEACLERATAIKQVHVSEQGQFPVTRIEAEREGVSALGYVLELSHLNAVFNDALAAEAAITRYIPWTVETVQRFHQGYQLTITREQTSQTLTTRLLVVADGARSNLRRQLGIGSRTHDYNQSALVGNVGLSNSHQNRAFERFTPSGPLALLPLRKQVATLVWTHARDNIETALSLSDAEYKAHLTKAFGTRLGPLTWVGPRQSFPLYLVEAKEQIRQGLVVMGNAAHSVHPVGGQGFNLSLRDVMALTKVLLTAQHDRDELASLPVLQRYLQQVQSDQKGLIGYTHLLVKGFSNDNAVLRVGRNSSLLALSLVPRLRSALAARNMGLQSFAELL